MRGPLQGARQGPGRLHSPSGQGSFPWRPGLLDLRTVGLPQRGVKLQVCACVPMRVHADVCVMCIHIPVHRAHAHTCVDVRT